MLDVNSLVKLADDWYKTVPVEMQDKVVAINFSRKSMSFTPNQIVKKIKAAARKSKTREDFLKESGLCAEFIETLEKMQLRRTKKGDRNHE